MLTSRDTNWKFHVKILDPAFIGGILHYLPIRVQGFSKKLFVSFQMCMMSKSRSKLRIMLWPPVLPEGKETLIHTTYPQWLYKGVAE